MDRSKKEDVLSSSRKHLSTSSPNVYKRAPKFPSPNEIPSNSKDATVVEGKRNTNYNIPRQEKGFYKVRIIQTSSSQRQILEIQFKTASRSFARFSSRNSPNYELLFNIISRYICVNMPQFKGLNFFNAIQLAYICSFSSCGVEMEDLDFQWLVQDRFRYVLYNLVSLC